MKLRLLSAVLVIFSCSLVADAQTDGRSRPVRRSDTQSVVIIPESQRPHVDSAALNPGKQKRRRRFEVKVVPAPPPGRSRQEILYTDSLGR